MLLSFYQANNNVKIPKKFEAYPLFSNEGFDYLAGRKI